MKNIFTLGLLIFILATSLYANTMPVMTPILATGITRYKAQRICDDKGMRLPTARELALYAQSHGAEGISSYEKEGYYLVRGQHTDGFPDHFYYSPKGFKIPEGEPINAFVWSKSYYHHYTKRSYALYYYAGDFLFDHSDDWDYNYVVKCVIE